jgi:hypothetical protein
MAFIAQGAASTSDMSTQAKPSMLARRKRHVQLRRAKRMPHIPEHRLSAATRAKTAVIHQGGKDKFPIPDKAHARAALGRINQAKPPLTDVQKNLVRRKARLMLGKGALAGDGRLERPAPKQTHRTRTSEGYAGLGPTSDRGTLGRTRALANRGAFSGDGRLERPSPGDPGDTRGVAPQKAAAGSLRRRRRGLGY